MDDPDSISGGINKVFRDIVQPDSRLYRQDVEYIFRDVIIWLLGMSAVIAVAVIVWGGFSYITSLGDDGKVEKAKHIIMYAVIGLLVTGAAFLIVRTVDSIL